MEPHFNTNPNPEETMDSKTSTYKNVAFTVKEANRITRMACEGLTDDETLEVFNDIRIKMALGLARKFVELKKKTEWFRDSLNDDLEKLEIYGVLAVYETALRTSLIDDIKALSVVIQMIRYELENVGHVTGESKLTTVVVNVIDTLMSGRTHEYQAKNQ
jgi:hypothetical protein